jgi:hypothetical protein
VIAGEDGEGVEDLFPEAPGVAVHGVATPLVLEHVLG